MAEQRERIVLEVDEKGVATSVSSANREVARLEASFARAGQTAEQRLLAKIATLQQRMANDPMRLKELDALQQRVLRRMQDNLDQAGNKFSQFGAKVRDAIQNPLQAAGNAAGEFLTAIGPIGAAIFGIGGAAIAVGAALHKLAEYTGEAAHEALNMAERTGLTTKEVGVFSGAAKLAGVDVGSLVTSTRLLSQALSENSEEGQKGKRVLSELGITVHDDFGRIRPMGALWLDIADALSKVESPADRARMAVSLFGRGALELLPLLRGNMREVSQQLREMGVGFTQEGAEKAEQYERALKMLEIQWAGLKKAFGQKIIGTIEIIFPDFLKNGKLPNLSGVKRFLMYTNPATAQAQWTSDAQWAAGLLGPEPARPGMPASKIPGSNDVFTMMGNQLLEAFKSQVGSSTEAKLKAAQEKFSQLYGELKPGIPLESQKRAVDAARAARQEVESLEAKLKAEKELDALRKQIDAYRKQADEAELSSGEKIIYIRDQMLKQAEKLKASAKDLAAIRSAADKLLQADYDKARKAFDEYEAKEARKRPAPPLGQPTKDQFNEWEWQFKADTEIPKINAAAQRSMLHAEGAKATRMAELTAMPGGEMDAITRAYQVRLSLARLIREEEMAAISEEATAGERRIAEAKAEADVRKEIRAAQIEAELKVAELQRRRFDELRSSMENLIDAAFAKSRGMWDAAKNLFQAVILTPIKQGVSTMMAQVLMPIMYGKDGRGGIMGRIFGMFRQDAPLKISTDINTTATDRNTVAIDNLAARLSMAPAGSAAGVGLSSGLAAAAGMGGLLALTGRTVGGEVIGAGRVASAGLERLPSGLYNRAGIPASGAGSATAGTAGYASRGIQWGQAAQGAALIGGGMLAVNGVQRGGTSGGIMTLGGGALMGFGLASKLGMTGYGGAIAGAGAGLAAWGLQRGGWSGVGMSTAGGAIVGMQFGGPIGAAIGAGVGLIAGLIRLGIKGAVQKCIEKVDQAYHLKIDKGIAQQIVDIAKQNYGSNLDVAIRAPQVLELLQLYAMSTGQSFGTQIKARAVNLVERGGQLMQNPLYENGSPLAFPGGLPVAGGGNYNLIPSNPNYPAAPVTPYAPAQPQTINLTLNPQQTLDVFAGKTVQVIQDNPRTVTRSNAKGLATNTDRRRTAQLILAPNALTS